MKKGQLAKWAKDLKQLEFDFTDAWMLERMKELEQSKEDSWNGTRKQGSAKGKFKGVKSIQTTFEWDTE